MGIDSGAGGGFVVQHVAHGVEVNAFVDHGTGAAVAHVVFLAPEVYEASLDDAFESSCF